MSGVASRDVRRAMSWPVLPLGCILLAVLDSIYRDWHPRRDVRGEVTLWVRVDCEGRARAVGIVEEGEHGFRLALLAHEALAFARFEPARDRGEPTAVYIQMPFRLPLRDPPRW